MSKLCKAGGLLIKMSMPGGERPWDRSPRLPRDSRKLLQEALLVVFDFWIIERNCVTFSATMPRAGSSDGGRSVGVELVRTMASAGDCCNFGDVPGEEEGAVLKLPGRRGTLLACIDGALGRCSDSNDRCRDSKGSVVPDAAICGICTGSTGEDMFSLPYLVESSIV